MTAALITTTWICMAWLSERGRHWGQSHMIASNQPRNGMSDHSQEIWRKDTSSPLAVQADGCYECKCKCLIKAWIEIQKCWVYITPFLNRYVITQSCLWKIFDGKLEIILPSFSHSDQTRLSSLCPYVKYCLAASSSLPPTAFIITELKVQSMSAH